MWIALGIIGFIFFIVITFLLLPVKFIIKNDKENRLPEGVMLTVYVVILDSMLVIGLIAFFISKVLRGVGTLCYFS